MSCKEVTGIEKVGVNENDRNTKHSELYTRILKEVFGEKDQTLIAHHLCYSQQIGDVFVVQEIPSADSLIFDHPIAKTIWGCQWKACLTRLALEPVETRDALLAEMYNNPNRLCAGGAK